MGPTRVSCGSSCIVIGKQYDRVLDGKIIETSKESLRKKGRRWSGQEAQADDGRGHVQL